MSNTMAVKPAGRSGTLLHDQARRFRDAFTELVRAYQFRDRDQVGCHGITVSQCYALDMLDRTESTTMGDLAGTLLLEPSSATRLMTPLVERGLAGRYEDPLDRRVCRIRITDEGRALASRIRSDLLHEYEGMLRKLPEESRESVIEAIVSMLFAFRSRQSGPIRNAMPDDRPAIERLLEESDLPYGDIGEHLPNFLVAFCGGRLTGVVGLEPLGRTGLLRSLAVDPGHRGKGFAVDLCDRLEGIARNGGVERLYLLTTTAEGFFERRGFERVARSRVPKAIRGTEEFRNLCPSTAVCMMKRIDRQEN